MAGHGDYTSWQSGASQAFTDWWSSLSSRDQQFMNNWAWMIDNNQLPGTEGDQTELRNQFNSLVGYNPHGTHGWDTSGAAYSNSNRELIESIMKSDANPWPSFLGSGLRDQAWDIFRETVGMPGKDGGAGGAGGGGADGGGDASSQISDFLKMLMSPPSEDDPTWQAVKANVQSQAGQTASMFGASGGGAAGFVNQSIAGALGQYELQRLGLGLNAAGLQSQNLQQGFMNQMLEYSMNMQRRQGMFGGLGGLLGGAAGAYFGGPEGAMAGYSLGSGLGSLYGSMGAGAAPQGPSFGYGAGYGGGTMSGAMRGF